jgi:iron complex outermembrane receptor protein
LTVRKFGAPDLGEIVNLDHVRAYGFELEGVWTPTAHLQLFLNYSYLNSRVRDSKACFVDAADPLALQPGANTAGCPPDGSQNLAGQTTPQSPPNKVVVGASYTLRFASGALTFETDYAWTDETYDEIFNRSYSLAPAFGVVDMRLVWTDARDRFTAILFGKNILDTIGYDDAEGSLNGDGTIARNFGLTPPATFGLQLQYRFR